MTRIQQLLLSLLCLPLLHRAAQAPVPVWGITADLRLDGYQYDLVPVSLFSVSSAGMMVVGPDMDHMMLFFAADGRLLGRFGWEGSGPGEFKVVGSYDGWPGAGNEFWIRDPVLHGITLLNSDRKLLRSIPELVSFATRPGISPLRATDLALLMIAPNFDFIVGAVNFGVRQSPEWEARLAGAQRLIIRIDRNGVFQRYLGGIRFSGTCAVTVGTVEVHLPSPLRVAPSIGFAKDGRRFTILEVFNLDRARAPSYRVISIGIDGDTLFFRTYTGEAVAIPKRVSDSVRLEMVKGNLNRPAVAEAWKKVVLSLNYPPATRVLVGRDGTTWVSLHRTETVRPWMVLDERGVPIGTVRLPKNVWIEAADRTAIWAVETHQDDIPSIVRYRITK